MRRFLTSLAVAAFCTSFASAQGGREDAFCENQDNCVDDTLEVHFGTKDGPSGVTITDEASVLAIFVSNTASDNVQGWSYGVSHDPAVLTIGDNPCEVAGDEFLCDTDANAARVAPSFNVSTTVDACPNDDGPDGPPGIISAVVLSFVAPASLNPGVNSLAQVPYNITGDLPAEGTVIAFEDNSLCNSPSPPVAINITVAGTAQLPRTLIQGVVSPAGGPEEDCETEGDEDGNGLADCDDPVCADLPACQTDDEVCDNGEDDDGDGDVDCADSDCATAPNCTGDWGFAFVQDGAAGGAPTTTIHITNELPALAFQGGVSTAGGNLSFTSALGTDNTRLVEMLITDNLGNSHEGDGLTLGGDVAFGDEVTSLVRGSAIADFADGDFFAFDLNPGVGGEGFTFGYVSDLDADTNQIPASGDGTNEVIVINGGDDAGGRFSRGDADGNGKINVSDAVNIIQVVLGNLNERFDCDDALDANDDGSTNISDAIPVLSWIFQRGARLPEPFLACGQDPTDDAVTCNEDSPNCSN